MKKHFKYTVSLLFIVIHFIVIHFSSRIVSALVKNPHHVLEYLLLEAFSLFIISSLFLLLFKKSWQVDKGIKLLFGINTVVILLFFIYVTVISKYDIQTINLIAGAYFTAISVFVNISGQFSKRLVS